MRPVVLARYWLPPLLLAALIFWASGRPSHAVAPLLPLPGLDKVAHFTTFGLLSLLLARALRHGGPSLPVRSAALLAVLLASLYGVTDELHQWLVPENRRTADVYDLVADSLGAAAFAFVWHRREARRSAPSPEHSA